MYFWQNVKKLYFKLHSWILTFSLGKNIITETYFGKSFLNINTVQIMHVEKTFKRLANPLKNKHALSSDVNYFNAETTFNCNVSSIVYFLCVFLVERQVRNSPLKMSRSWSSASCTLSGVSRSSSSAIRNPSGPRGSVCIRYRGSTTSSISATIHLESLMSDSWTGRVSASGESGGMVRAHGYTTGV